MSRRAFSMRAARSSFVIGFARSRIEVSAAILAGTGPASGLPRPRWADTRVTDSPTAAPASESNERREIMKAPNQLENITIERRGPTFARWRFSELRLGKRKRTQRKTGFLCGLRGLRVPRRRQLVGYDPSSDVAGSDYQTIRLSDSKYGWLRRPRHQPVAVPAVPAVRARHRWLRPSGRRADPPAKCSGTAGNAASRPPGGRIQRSGPSTYRGELRRSRCTRR